MTMNRALLCLLFVLLVGTSCLRAQSSQEALTPEQLSQLLKEEWTFLHETVDEFLKATATRDEFETVPEYEVRMARERKAYLGKVESHVNEKKLGARIFSTLFKAQFVRYHIDSAYYAITAPVPIEAPYDIPQLSTVVPENPFLGLADTTERGFRKSNLFLKFRPEFRWSVTREIARAAREDSANVAFRVRFLLNLAQDASSKQAVLRIIPREIALVNALRKNVYWKEDIK